MATDAKLARVRAPDIRDRAPASRNATGWLARFDSSDIATVALLAALVVHIVTVFLYW